MRTLEGLYLSEEDLEELEIDNIVPLDPEWDPIDNVFVPTWEIEEND